MARSLLDAVRLAIRRHGLLARGDTVLVAVSGGADSVALLHALVELRAELGVALAVGHVDHGLRGAESAADRAFVEALAAGLGLPIECGSLTVASVNVEAEARRARYAFLEAAADRLGANRIATAHTLDDQAETVLLRLVRGAGRRGLGGIRPRRGRIVRPLLLCDRVQVRYFLADRALAWRVDRSNFDLRFERARMRLGFLPALARELNPRLPRALARLADVVREEDRLLDGLARAALSEPAVLEAPILAALDPPLARRAVLRWWRRHGSGRRVGGVHVEAIIALPAREGSARTRVPGGTVVRDGTHLRFVPGTADEPVAAPYAFALARGATIDVPGGWRLGATIASRAAAPRPDAMTCVADADALPDVLTVRNRRAGDRMRPLGLGGTTTVKRLLIARKVPRAARALWPVVTAAEEVLWVPGCARSEHARVGDATRTVVVVRAEKRG